MIAFVYLVFWIQIWSWCILGTSSFQSYKLHATTPSATSLWVRHVVQMSSTPSTSIESTPFVRRRNRVGIDYGPRFIGIAWSDFFGNVQTHAMLSNSGNLTDIALKILSVARSYAAAEIVLGIPIDPVGQLNYDIKSFNGQLCLNFSKVLSAVVNHETKQRMKVMLFDERYTTKEAKIKLAMSKTKGIKLIKVSFLSILSNSNVVVFL